MAKKHTLTAKDLLPLSPTVFHLLLALGAGERHGYALKREVSRRTNGAINPGAGMLCGSISRMLEQGLIEESEERPDAHLDDERRRYYRITPFGRKVAQADAARMNELVRLAAAKFGAPRHA